MSIKLFASTVVALILGSLTSYSQHTPFEVLAQYKSLYPEESGIVTDYKKIITIKNTGDSITISSRQYREILVLDKPSRWVKEQVFGSSFSEIKDLAAYTLLPGKKKYKKVEVEDFKKSYDKESYVFFSDTEVINYNYPQLMEGAKIVTDYTSNLNDPRIIGNFFFASYVPTLHAKFQIIADAGIEIKHGLMNDTSVDIKYSEEVQEDGVTIYTYEADNLSKVKYERDNPGFAYLSPLAYLIVERYATDDSGGKVDVLSSLDDLHIWYRTFVEHLPVDSSLSQITQAIVSDSDSDLEKVRKIFYWVQKNIKYIAFEDGMRGFIPHPADYVYEKRYGDCKDMSSLLVGLLRSEGISARYTWIGTRDLPYKYSDIHSPIVDNHMIATVELDGQYLFLDATGSYSPLGLPTSMIQGKETLISLGKDRYEIRTVPIVEKEENQILDTAYVKMSDGMLLGEGKMMLTGLAKVENTYSLIQKNAKREEDYVKSILEKGNNKFLLDDYTLRNVENLDRPVEIDYSFNVADYYRTAGDEIYINLCLIRELDQLEIKDRQTPIEADYKFTAKLVTVLEIPAGYKVSYLPEGGSVSSSNIGFEVSYQVDENTITCINSVYSDFLFMSPSEFKDWNETIDAYSSLTRKTIVLEKTL